MTVLRPPMLRSGDRVAVVAPGGPLQRLPVEPGVELIASWGLEPILGASVRGRHGFLAGSDDERLADLQLALDDPSIRAIFCARGGYGTGRIIDRLDLSGMRRNPKIVVGYSDVTALHLLLRKELGLVSFHGPVLARNWEADGWSADHLRRTLMSPGSAGRLPHPAGYPPVETLVPGEVTGPVVGGNLTLLAGSLGTPTAVDASAAILLIEEVHEAPYAVDHLLTQLRRAGVLEAAAGVVVGECLHCEAGPDDPPSPAVRDVFAEVFVSLGLPSVYGVACGHGAAQLTVPLGVPATLDAAAGTLTIIEAATTG